LHYLTYLIIADFILFSSESVSAHTSLQLTSDFSQHDRRAASQYMGKQSNLRYLFEKSN